MLMLQKWRLGAILKANIRTKHIQDECDDFDDAHRIRDSKGQSGAEYDHCISNLAWLSKLEGMEFLT